MQEFLKPSDHLERVFTLMAMSSSYTEDVIDKKRDEENAEQIFADDPASGKAAAAALRAIINAPELAPLTREEIMQVLMGIQYYHGLAYDWNPDISEETLYKETEKGGYLLRTKIRAAIEFLDRFQILIVRRDGDDPETELRDHPFLSQYQERFRVISAPDGLDGISSSAVREKLRDGIPGAEEMLHPKVWDILQRNGGIRK